MSITDFLLARVAEDAERVDNIPDWYCTDSARGDGWGSRGSECDLCEQYMFDGDEASTKEAWRDHMENRHDRTRVLAECAAKRSLIEIHAPIKVNYQKIKESLPPLDQRIYGWQMDPNNFENIGEGQDCSVCSTCHDYPCATVRALAAVYADHESYDPSWAVT